MSSEEFLATAREWLGDRLVDGRDDPFLGLQVAVVAPSAEELAGLTRLAADHGVGDRLRTRAADPADLRTWRSLSRDLRRLDADAPQLLLADPVGGRILYRLPVDVSLTSDPAAQPAAAYLRDRYHPDVRVDVGRLSHGAPLRGRPTPTGRVAGDLAVGLSGPLSVRRGDGVVHGLDVADLGDEPIVVETDGEIVADVVDRVTGEVVGGIGSAWRTQPMVRYPVDPGDTVRIPLLVGTVVRPDFVTPVPAGRWHLVARLDLADGRHLTTPALDVTITD